MYKFTEKQLKDMGFKCTDNSKETEQWLKKVSNVEFQVYEKHRDEMNTVYINDFTEEELMEQITGYYQSLEELRKEYGEDSNQIIAEIISEMS